MKPLRDTKLGQWMKEKVPQALSIVGDVLPDKGLVGIVKHIISKDENISPEVKAELEAKSYEFEHEILEMILADVANAREHDAKIQGDHPSWMSKNVAYMIDLFVTTLWGGLTVYLMSIMLNFIEKDANADYTAVTAVWGAITGVFTQVLSFHRGSSRGSEDKQKAIDRMLRK